MRRVGRNIRASSAAAALALCGWTALGSGCSGGHERGAGDEGGGPGGSRGQAAVPPEVDGRITINELMAANVLTVADEAGAPRPWVELHNPTDRDIPLDRYAFSSERSLSRPAVIPNGVVLPPGGHVVFWLDGSPERGATHLEANLDEDGGALALLRPDNSIVDHVVYGAQEVDLSAAREPDGSSAWAIEWHATPGAANPDGPGQPAEPDLPGAQPEEIPSAADVSERVLGYDVLPRLDLTISLKGLQALLVSPYELVEATLSYEGRGYGPIGVRLKGQNSFRPIDEKPSLRLAIDRYVQGARFLGLKDMTLNNMTSDGSMLHERLAYLIARRAGIPASRANHVELWVNGELYGLYTQVETVKRKMLARWFTNADGALFEATDVDLVPDLIAGYALESGPDERHLLAAAATALTQPAGDQAVAAASPYINMDEFRRYWAFCSVVGQFDAFPYSMPGDDYFAYQDPATGRIWFLPWGMDETFFAPDFDPTNVWSVLAKACRASPACFQDYVDKTWELLAMVEGMDWLGEQARVAAQIAPYVARDTRKPYTDAEVAEQQRAVRYFMTLRREYLGTVLPPPRP